jgi:hypothetical protein
MRNLALSLCLVGCATTSPSPRCTGSGIVLDQEAAQKAHEYHRDGVAFAIPAIALTLGGLVTGAADISLKPNDPQWLRGTSLGLLGAGVLASAVAYTFSVLASDEREKAVQKCVTVSDATRR